MLTVDELAIKYETDKSSLGHDYARVYDRYFSGLKDKPITLLEIGVAEGRSLKVWEDYFPAAAIVGIDINPECKKYETGRVKVFIGDQADKVFLQSFGNMGFDIIIDDGSHNSPDIAASLSVLFSFLNPLGLYVIEDLGCARGSNSGIRNVLYDLLKTVISVKPGAIASMHFYKQLCIIVKG